MRKIQYHFECALSCFFFFFNPSRVVCPIFLSPKLPVFKKIYELLEEYKPTPQYRYRFVHQLFHFLGKVNSTYGLIYPYIVVKEDYNDQWIKVQVTISCCKFSIQKPSGQSKQNLRVILEGRTNIIHLKMT